MLSRNKPIKKSLFNVTFDVTQNYIKKILVADNSEHVPLLVMKQIESSTKNSKLSNGNGLKLIEHSEHQPEQQHRQLQTNHILQSQISPVVLSSNVQSQVMKSRLNQYNETGGLSSVVVRLNDENGTETILNGKASKMKNKNFAEI